MTTEPITTTEIAELRRLHEAATPGPWFVQDVPGSYAYVAHWVEHAGERLRGEPDTDDDLRVAAAARNALPRLLDEIERLRAVIRRTHTTHCTDWPTHSPWCLLYEVEP